MEHLSTFRKLFCPLLTSRKNKTSGNCWNSGLSWYTWALQVRVNVPSVVMFHRPLSELLVTSILRNDVRITGAKIHCKNYICVKIDFPLKFTLNVNEVRVLQAAAATQTWTFHTPGPTQSSKVTLTFITDQRAQKKESQVTPDSFSHSSKHWCEQRRGQKERERRKDEEGDESVNEAQPWLQTHRD